MEGEYSYRDTVDGLEMTVSTTYNWQTTGTGFDVFNPYGLYVLTKDSYTMTFRFDQKVRFESFDVGRTAKLAGDESITFSVNSVVQTTENNFADGVHDFSNKFVVEADTDIVMTCLNPNYIMYESVIWKSLTVTVVPEPAAYALMLGGLVLIVSLMRRKRL